MSCHHQQICLYFHLKWSILVITTLMQQGFEKPASLESKGVTDHVCRADSPQPTLSFHSFPKISLHSSLAAVVKWHHFPRPFSTMYPHMIRNDQASWAVLKHSIVKVVRRIIGVDFILIWSGIVIRSPLNKWMGCFKPMSVKLLQKTRSDS